MSNQMLALVLVILIAAVAAYGFLWAFLKYRSVRRRFAPIIDIEKEHDRLKAERDGLTREVEKTRLNWKTEYEETIKELEQLTKQTDQVRGQVEIESFGVYETQYDWESSDKYKERLTLIRGAQKEMIRAGDAAVCSVEWQVEGSAAKGRQMSKRQLKLMLRAFNGECDAAVGKVRYNNVVALRQRLERSFAAINKLGETNKCQITTNYLALKQDELNLAHEYNEKRQEEKEEQRRIREQMREEEQVRREIEKAKTEAEKDEKRYNEALEKARGELQAADDNKRAELETELEELQRRLEEAQENKERALSRAQLTKSGHVYVISNIGSFGEGVYKIGLTRRLDPIERVKELGDASVPFGFDVHAMIYSDDAPELENLLHKHFDGTRLNLVNNRKEFFRVALDQIEEIAKTNDAQIEFTKVAEAEDYRKTCAIRADRETGRERPAKADQLDDAKKAFEQRIARWSDESGSV